MTVGVPTGRFDDTDGNVHAGAIEAVAEVGITMGYDDGTYRPASPVRRDQTASFLVRLVDVLDAE